MQCGSWCLPLRKPEDFTSLTCVMRLSLPTITVFYITVLHCKQIYILISRQISILIFRHKLDYIFNFTYFKIFHTSEYLCFELCFSQTSVYIFKSWPIFFLFVILFDSFFLHFISDCKIFCSNITCNMLLTLSSTYGRFQTTGQHFLHLTGICICLVLIYVDILSILLFFAYSPSLGSLFLQPAISRKTNYNNFNS